MAALIFPKTRLNDDPLQSGDQYVGDNGVTYIYDGVKWVGHSRNLTPGTSSLINDVHVAKINIDGTFELPSYTFNNSTGTTGQILTWPSTGTVLTWTYFNPSQLINGAYTVELNDDGTLDFPNNTIDAGTSSIAVASYVSSELAWHNNNITGDAHETLDAYVGVDSSGTYIVNESTNSDSTGTNINVWYFDTSGILRIGRAGLGPYGLVQNVGADIVDGNGNSLVYVTSTATAPVSSPNGQLWFNSVEGRAYIKYQDVWVDLSPTVIPQPSTYLDELSISGTTISQTNTTGTAAVIINNNTSSWQFGADGGLVFPNDTVQTTAWAGSTSQLTNGTWTFAVSSTGAVTLNGDPFVSGGGTASSDRLTTGSYSLILGANGVTTFPDGTTSTGAVIRAVQSSSYIIQTLSSAVASPSNVLSTFEFGVGGTLTLPQGGTIAETTTTMVLTPPGALAGQGLVIRTTTGGGLQTTDTFTPGGAVTVTFYDNGSYFATGGYTTPGSESNTWTYTITGISQADLGSPLTGVFLGENWTIVNSNSVNTTTFNIPAQSQGTGFVITLDKIITDPPYRLMGVTLDGAGRNSLTVGSVTTGSEISHVHLTSADPATVDLYLGDDDQYVKIEKNHGNVVIGTNTNTNHWTFGTDGKLTLPDAGTISNSIHDWQFGDDGVLTIPDGGIVGGPVGTNKIDLSWDLSIISGKTIKINPGSGGVVSPTFFGFNSDASGGGIALPAGSSIDDRLTGVLISGAGLLEVNRFYPKVSNTLYEAVDAGVTYRLINQAGTWSLDVVGANNPQYTSADLVTWANTGGGLPAPTGELTTRATTLTVGTSTWVFGTDGVLTLPAATPVIKGGGTGTDVTIIAQNTATTSTWVFGATGGLTFPDATVQTTAWNTSTEVYPHQMVSGSTSTIHFLSAAGTYITPPERPTYDPPTSNPNNISCVFAPLNGDNAVSTTTTIARTFTTATFHYNINLNAAGEWLSISKWAIGVSGITDDGY